MTEAIDLARLALGPAADGGYYLVGLRRPTPALFSGVPWGESGVLDKTLERVDAEGLTLALLPIWYDVDDLQSVLLLRSLM